MNGHASAGEGPAPTPPECCHFCRYFVAKLTDERALSRARAAGATVHEGICRFFPQAVPKTLGDWCGQYHPGESK
jgi:hypothetical protein